MRLIFTKLFYSAMRRAYLSGKISGLPIEEARAKFQKAEDELILKGWQVVNPLKKGLPVESTWGQHLLRDIELLMDCDAIFLMPCWQESQGAKIEKFFAEKEFGLEIYFI